MELRKSNDKYILEFDAIPAFIYVCEDIKKEVIFKEGERVKNWRSLHVVTGMEEIPTHTIEYVTAKERNHE